MSRLSQSKARDQLARSRKSLPSPKVGDWADHVSRELDPRRVVAVSATRDFIRLEIGPRSTSWVPAVNYTYKERL